MKKHIIANKKVFLGFVVAVILVSAFIFLLYKIFNFNRVKNGIAQKTTSTAMVNNKISASSSKSTGAQDMGEQKSSDKPQPKTVTGTEYNNQRYKYAITFSDAWYINNETSESAPESSDAGGKTVLAGGQTFWSNYQNMNDYSPDNKPANFHLLGLTVYTAQNMRSDDFAATLGFDDKSIIKKTVFEAKGISGTEYLAATDDINNPQVMVIFEKNGYLYVFNLGFINGDKQAVLDMENIISTFSVK